MTHKIVVNCETGQVTQVEYTAEEQAAHDSKVVAQDLAALVADGNASSDAATVADEIKTAMP